MDVVLIPMLKIVLAVIDIYIWVVLISVVLSWLVAFNVVNTSNRLVYMIGNFTYRLTEPALRPIRNTLASIFPNLGGVDLSPVVLILILWFAQEVLIRIVTKFI